MKGDKYPQILAKIQVSAIFHMQDIWRNDSPKIYRALYGDAMLLPIQMDTNMAARNQKRHLLCFVLQWKQEYISQGTHKC